jgi:hypothetical protein
MTTCSSGDSYNINGTAIKATTLDVNVCNVTKILENLHKDFTEEYSTTTLDANKDKPSYYLRNQPTSYSNADRINRFYNIMAPVDASGIINDNNYKKMISVIMKGAEDTSVTYDTIPSSIKNLNNFNESPEFKGIYGLNKVVELLDASINTLLTTLTTKSIPTAANSGNAILKYNQRSDIKNTLEEIAYRENQIYREKFLNIILIVVGIILVGSQLTQKFFSGGGGGAGGGAGLGGSFGFGLGSSGGLFSRFGGLGLGSSGRSHFDIGNLFKNSSYTLKQR